MTSSAQKLLPTARPWLPTADSIMPYLKVIDANRHYSNFGPLVRRFEDELAVRSGAPEATVVTASNATSGLALVVRDVTNGEGGLCICPSWTFIGSAVAIQKAGLEPLFVDVDPSTWQVTPDIVRAALKTHGKRVQAVMVVAPFGGEVPTEVWSGFSEETGLPVVIDGASAFDITRWHEGLTAVVSLHATKVLGIGEGAFILAKDEHQATRLRRMSNFGLNSDRKAVLVGDNAKLSEYGAAVGLSALHQWESRRASLLAQGVALRNAIAATPAIMCAGNTQIASSTFNVIAPPGQASALIDWLNHRGIEARKWWQDGCHRHPIFGSALCKALPITEQLTSRVVGIPFFVDLTADDVNLVASSLASYDRSRRERPGADAQGLLPHG